MIRSMMLMVIMGNFLRAKLDWRKGELSVKQRDMTPYADILLYNNQLKYLKFREKNIPSTVAYFATEDCNIQKYDLLSEKFNADDTIYPLMKLNCFAMFMIKRETLKKWRVTLHAFDKTAKEEKKEKSKQDQKIIFVYGGVQMIECKNKGSQVHAYSPTYYESMMNLPFRQSTLFRISDVHGHYDPDVSGLVCEFSVEFSNLYSSGHDTTTGIEWLGPNLNASQDPYQTISSLNLKTSDVDSLVNGEGKCQMQWLQSYYYVSDYEAEREAPGFRFINVDFEKYPIKCHTMYVAIKDDERGFKRQQGDKIECTEQGIARVHPDLDYIKGKYIIVKCMEPTGYKNLHCTDSSGVGRPSDPMSLAQLDAPSRCWTCYGDHRDRNIGAGNGDCVLAEDSTRVGSIRETAHDAFSACGLKDKQHDNCILRLCKGLAGRSVSHTREFYWTRHSSSECPDGEYTFGYVVSDSQCCKKATVRIVQCYYGSQTNNAHRWFGVKENEFMDCKKVDQDKYEETYGYLTSENQFYVWP